MHKPARFFSYLTPLLLVLGLIFLLDLRLWFVCRVWVNVSVWPLRFNVQRGHDKGGVPQICQKWWVAVTLAFEQLLFGCLVWAKCQQHAGAHATQQTRVCLLVCLCMCACAFFFFLLLLLLLLLLLFVIALALAMARDGSSGGVIRTAVITADGVEREVRFSLCVSVAVCVFC